MPSRRPLLLLLPLLLAASLTLAGCSGIDVHSDHDPFTDFASYTSFSFLGVAASAEDPASADLDAGNIEAAIESALTAKGLSAAPRDSAGLLVRHRLHLEEKVKVNDPYYSFHAVETYEEGTLVIDLMDRATERRVWHGTGTTRIQDVTDPDQRRALIERVAAAILDEFPPAPR